MKLRVRDLDVGLLYPGVAEDSKGAAVLGIKEHMSWVKNDVSQFGFYLLGN